MIALPDGYYSLSRDVANPQRDKRRHGIKFAETLERGSRYLILNRTVERGGIQVPQAYVFQFGGSRLEDDQVEAVWPFLAPEPPRAGQRIDRAQERTDNVLAMLIALGKVSLEDIDAAVTQLEAIPVDDHQRVTESLRHHHWL